MPYTDGRLRQIYDKNAGYCWYCGKKLAWRNYGVAGARGAWEVDHGRPRSRGGTEHLNNLHPACIPCNRAKSNTYPY